MMMWRSLKAGTILAALRQPKKGTPAQKQAPNSASDPQPKPAH